MGERNRRIWRLAMLQRAADNTARIVDIEEELADLPGWRWLRAMQLRSERKRRLLVRDRALRNDAGS